MTEESIQYLPCPVCGTSIPFTVRGLLSGERFVCPKCSSVVSISENSKETVSTAMTKLEKLKSNGENSGEQ